LAPENWNKLIAGLPNPHLLQTIEWAKAKEPFGWTAHYKTWEERGETVAAAQILERSISLPLGKRVSMLYVPKGPLLDWENAAVRDRVMADLRSFTKDLGAFFIKIDPDLAYGFGLPGEANERPNLVSNEVVDELKSMGWRLSNEQVQMQNTMLINASQTEEQLLAGMKQKARYNLRLAEKKGVVVRRGTPTDFSEFYKMYAETSMRDGFVIRSEEYYRAVWDQFYKAEMLIPLVAEVENEIVAGLMLFVFGARSWYLYGMSRDRYRDWMPNYLLQWEAIKASKAAGCNTYDLWGAPDEFNETDPMWGVYRFKLGLGAYEARHIGAWDLPVKPLVYAIYTQVLPRIVAAMRWRGRRATRRQMLDGEPG
jgi:lipid II:glycine glycyltransferase (peptidoglycan interpeptide bridge formation enzyme)